MNCYFDIIFRFYYYINNYLFYKYKLKNVWLFFFYYVNNICILIEYDFFDIF